MALTPPPEGTAAYYGPVTVRWTAGDMMSAGIQLQQEFIDTLSDDDLAQISQIIDAAVARAWPELRVLRFTEWAPSVPIASSEVVVQETGGA